LGLLRVVLVVVDVDVETAASTVIERGRERGVCGTGIRGWGVDEGLAVRGAVGREGREVFVACEGGGEVLGEGHVGGR